MLRDGTCTCIEVDHKAAIHKYYDDIKYALTTVSQNTIKTPKPSMSETFNMSDWKDFTSDLYDMS